jgi:hypothetical protein
MKSLEADKVRGSLAASPLAWRLPKTLQLNPVVTLIKRARLYLRGCSRRQFFTWIMPKTESGVEWLDYWLPRYQLFCRIVIAAFVIFVFGYLPITGKPFCFGL